MVLERRPTLDSYLHDWAEQDSARIDIATTVLSLADGVIKVSELISLGSLAGESVTPVVNGIDADAQEPLDLQANQLFLAALDQAPVAVIGSRANGAVLASNEDAPFVVVIDPLEGAANIDINASIGTIFSILPFKGSSSPDSELSLLQRGGRQLAAGFAIYGPQTVFALTVRNGVAIFVLDRRRSEFIHARSNVQIRPATYRYAINAANYSYWERPVRAYIDDCIASARRPEGNLFNMCWTGSLVTEAFRILSRGGIFLSPRAGRPGHESGRLRHVHQVNPIALLIEQAGGAATDGARRVLAIEPSTLNACVPFVFGSSDHVERVTRYHTKLHFDGDAAPLFAKRGLFQN